MMIEKEYFICDLNPINVDISTLRLRSKKIYNILVELANLFGSCIYKNSDFFQFDLVDVNTIFIYNDGNYIKIVSANIDDTGTIRDLIVKSNKFIINYTGTFFVGVLYINCVNDITI